MAWTFGDSCVHHAGAQSQGLAISTQQDLHFGILPESHGGGLFPPLQSGAGAEWGLNDVLCIQAGAPGCWPLNNRPVLHHTPLELRNAERRPATGVYDVNEHDPAGWLPSDSPPSP